MRQYENIIVWAFVLMAAVISSYATFLGLEADRQEFYFCLFISVFSFVALLASNYWIGIAVFRESGIRKAIGVALPILMIFWFSTLWSITGLARNELFAIQVESVATEVSRGFDPSGITSYSKSLIAAISTVIDLLEGAEAKARKGFYTGADTIGPLAQNFRVAIDKLSLRKQQLEAHRIGRDSIISEIDGLINGLRQFKSYDSKDAFLVTVRKVVDMARGISLTVEREMVDGIQTTLSQVESNIEEFSSKTITKKDRQNLVQVEVQEIRSTVNRFKKRLGSGQSQMKLDIAVPYGSLSTQLWVLALSGVDKVFNWWGFCFAFDYAPVALMMFHQRRRRLEIFTRNKR